MTTEEKLKILKSYGFIDILAGFRTTTIDLYRSSNLYGTRAYMRNSGNSIEEATDKLYYRLGNNIYRKIIEIYNENMLP